MANHIKYSILKHFKNEEKDNECPWNITLEATNILKEVVTYSAQLIDVLEAGVEMQQDFFKAKISDLKDRWYRLEQLVRGEYD